MSQTIRERIDAVSRQLLERAAMTPTLAMESEVTLSALLANVMQEAREAELAYKPVLLKCMDGTKAANRARIEAECTQEYARLLEAKHYEKVVQQSLTTCRSFLRSFDQERRFQR